MVVNPSVLTRRSDISRQWLKNTEKDTPVGQHIRQCDSDSGSLEFNWKKIDEACDIRSEWRRDAWQLRICVGNSQVGGLAVSMDKQC